MFILLLHGFPDSETWKWAWGWAVRSLTPAVTLPLLSRLKLQPPLTSFAYKKEQQCRWRPAGNLSEVSLSCCSRGPPEGPRHPLIKYTSPTSTGTLASGTLLWEGDTGVDKMEGVQLGWEGGEGQDERMEERRLERKNKDRGRVCLALYFTTRKIKLYWSNFIFSKDVPSLGVLMVAGESII